MPRRQKLTLVELLIIVAILGILAAIVMPALYQAQQRSLSSRSRASQSYDSAQERSAADGQLNTIEVSELSQSRESNGPAQHLGALFAVLPIIVGAALLLIVFGRLRRQMSGPA